MSDKRICPNCNGELILRNGRYECEYCGSTFAIDYDKDDVNAVRQSAHEEADRVRDERARAYDQAKAEIEQRENADRTKRSFGRMKTILIIIGIAVVAPYLLRFLVLVPMMAGNTFRNKAFQTIIGSTTATTSTASEFSGYQIDNEVIEKDPAYMKEALQSALYLVKDESLNEIVIDDVTYRKTGSYELTDIKLLTSYDDNYLFFIYQIEYENPEDAKDKLYIYGNSYLRDITETEHGVSGSISPHSYGVWDAGLVYGYYDKNTLIDSILNYYTSYEVYEVSGGYTDEVD